ncbi:Inner membrane ABC transporter permease protein ycjP [Actinomyces bovis]|uniref:Inner membrane ABC transporter permease protein ycjP n=1 Tax=Actinomyces bovis TaxID=1658 RepID=A0ABY1VPV8_9ACTO|nr:carbohydrate ABC transporter permease [Actinomyces bovis]SPT53717.1 Inner membrane ABC transporter permease protein ycjP [Actinomyces bovis]VEG55865.1 Inner membrane ABC transporter permease protein ycjP [Actinomyces israelii]
MSVTTSQPTASAPMTKPYRDRFWRRKGESDFLKPTPAGAVARYLLLALLAVIAVFPFLWELSTSFKGAAEDIYAFPPQLVPSEPTTAHYETVSNTIPILKYAWHSLLLGLGTVASQVFFSICGGYALGVLRFKGKKLVMAVLLSTMLLPGEVTLTSQYLTVKSLGFANTLFGVFLPGAIGAINVLLVATACSMIPRDIIEAAEIDGASTWQRIRHIVWPNIRGMVSVVALFSFIGAWDDFLWPLVVLSDPEKYTLTVGMQYLHSNFGSNPRVVAAGTVIALVPIIILFALAQKQFFKGVQEGGVKG